MKRNVTAVIVAVSLSLLLSGVLSPYGKKGLGLVPGVRADDGAAAAPQIEGTWLLTVTPPPESGRTPFQVLISFARGGVFLASAEARAQGLPAQYGTWKKAGSNEYVATALSFGTGATPSDVFAFKVKSLFRVVGEDELEGAGELAICDASGNNCQSFPGCSMLRAERLGAEEPSCPGT
jgi:hypothetical protein